MNWKKERQVCDLIDDETISRIDFTCKKCGKFYTKSPAELTDMFPGYLWLDQVESNMKCQQWGCGGACRMEIPQNIKLEGFQGGMA